MKKRAVVVADDDGSAGASMVEKSVKRASLPKAPPKAIVKQAVVAPPVVAVANKEQSKKKKDVELALVPLVDQRPTNFDTLRAVLKAKSGAVPSIRTTTSPELSDWLGKFRDFIYTTLSTVYEDKHRNAMKLAVSDGANLTVWIRAFTDASFSSDSYESLETVGDKLYGTAFLKYVYAKTGGGVTPRELSNMITYYGSGGFMEKIAKALQFDKWILKNESIELNEKLISNLVESYIGALDMVCDAVRASYLEAKDYEVAALCPTGFEAVQRFVSAYFDGANIDLTEGAHGPSKTFITQIPDLFGMRGRWEIKTDLRTRRAVFRIYKYSKDEGNLALSLAKAVASPGDSDRAIAKIESFILELNGTEGDNEGVLSDTIVAKLESVGINRDWFNEYRDKSRVENIYPAQLREVFTTTFRDNGYSKVVFEYSESHAHEVKGGGKISTVLLYGVRRSATDQGGKDTTRTLLHTTTGEVLGNNDYSALKNRCAKEWVEKVGQRGG